MLTCLGLVGLVRVGGQGGVRGQNWTGLLNNGWKDKGEGACEAFPVKGQF